MVFDPKSIPAVRIRTEDEIQEAVDLIEQMKIQQQTKAMLPLGRAIASSIWGEPPPWEPPPWDQDDPDNPVFVPGGGGGPPTRGGPPPGPGPGPGGGIAEIIGGLFDPLTGEPLIPSGPGTISEDPIDRFPRQPGPEGPILDLPVAGVLPPGIGPPPQPPPPDPMDGFRPPNHMVPTPPEPPVVTPGFIPPGGGISGVGHGGGGQGIQFAPSIVGGAGFSTVPALSPRQQIVQGLNGQRNEYINAIRPVSRDILSGMSSPAGPVSSRAAALDLMYQPREQPLFVRGRSDGGGHDA
jgi:hypothetical protein